MYRGHLIGLVFVSLLAAEVRTGVNLPDGREFISWEQPLSFTRTYYVDNRNPKASDSNPGTQELPFLTINRAAQVLQAGQRVLIMTGVYRERVDPARGGAGPDKMISYEAAPGADVVVKGSRLIKKGWEPSTGFRLGYGEQKTQAKVFQLNLEPLPLGNYNPFAMVNILDDRSATANIGAPPRGLKPYLARRGLVFVDGKRLEQIELYREFALKEGSYWAEHNGLFLHIRLPGDANPADHDVEVVVQEQVFAPRTRYLGFIRVKGITFEHAANGFPVPQRGLVSANRGHHWIIEDCVVRHANAVAVDIGNETWNADRTEVIGNSIVRRNRISDAGLCGLAGMGVMNTLVEFNTLERVGWQDAEGMWESGAIKLHTTKNCLLRNNLIRHLHYAPGIWLDYGNTNTRVTRNTILDVLESLRGGIYLEASHDRNMLDHNIIWNTTGVERDSPTGKRLDGGWCIINDGSDEAIIANNLLGRCENAGVQTRTVESRIVEGRGGTARLNQVIDNIFFRCGKSIQFSHQENKAEGNIYARARRGDSGLNWIETPQTLRLDLPAWQRYFGFDKAGAYAQIEIEIDTTALNMTWSVSGTTAAASSAKPGPFGRVPEKAEQLSIDPR